MSSAPILAALEALPKYRKVGTGWKALCPAHDDRNPSLTGTFADDGRVLMKCQAGCTTEAVVAAMGYTMADLFPPKVNGAAGPARPQKPARPPMPERRWTVLDIEGEEWTHVRSGDRRWWEPNGAHLDKLRPYGSELASDPVYLVEGEPAADALRSLGLVAMATLGTSYRPVRDALACLSDRQVLLWPDADSDPRKGRAHMLDLAERLAGIASTVQWIEPPSDVFDGWDAADADEATVRRLIETPGAVPQNAGVRLTAASTIKVRPVRWLWHGRLALGTLALLGGREGIGKTTVAYTIAADVTRGRLPGAYAGQPKAVIVAASEDAWAETIVPRLMAAGADLNRVFRVDVVDVNGTESGLSLPRDVADLERRIGDVDAAMILLDPLMSRLDGKLDTHKDAEVRLALEPLVAIANRTGTTVLGIIHVNKGTSIDPLSMLMGSRAFAAVARAVLFMMTDPEDATIRLLGQPKNNLGRIDDLPTLALRIESAHVADTDEGPVMSGRVVWLGESSISIGDALSDREQAASRTKTARLADAMRAIVETNGGSMSASDGYRALEPEWSDDLASEDLKTRARNRAGIRSENRNGTWWWVLAASHSPTTDRGFGVPVGPVSASSMPPTDTPVSDVSPVAPVSGPHWSAGMSVSEENDVIFSKEVA